MKLSTIYRYQNKYTPTEADSENTDPLEQDGEQEELADDGIPDDMENRQVTTGYSAGSERQKNFKVMFAIRCIDYEI